MTRRSCLLAFLIAAALVATSAAQTPPASPACAPQWSSGGQPMHAFGCKVGQTCSDAFGYRIEALHGDERSGIAIRDIDRRYCQGRPTRTDVVTTNGKTFRFADCTLPYWWVQEFAAFEVGCYVPTTVITVLRGAITVRP